MESNRNIAPMCVRNLGTDCRYDCPANQAINTWIDTVAQVTGITPTKIVKILRDGNQRHPIATKLVGALLYPTQFCETDKNKSV